MIHEHLPGKSVPFITRVRHWTLNKAARAINSLSLTIVESVLTPKWLRGFRHTRIGKKSILHYIDTWAGKINIWAAARHCVALDVRRKFKRSGSPLNEWEEYAIAGGGYQVLYEEETAWYKFADGSILYIDQITNNDLEAHSLW